MYQPDPPFQLYWPEDAPPLYQPEHRPVYQPEYRGSDYWAEAPVRTYWADEPPREEKTEPVTTSIWSTPIYAPHSVPVHRTPPSAPQSQPAPQQQPAPSGVHKPLLTLVPPVSGPASAEPEVAPAPEPKIVDRRVLLVEARHAVRMVHEAGDEDGFTNEELEWYYDELEEELKQLGGKLKPKRGLLSRFAKWMKSDES